MKIQEEIKSNLTQEGQTNKIEMLNARFAKMGWEPLTEKELKRFSEKKAHRLKDDYVDLTEMKAMEKRMAEEEAEIKEQIDDMFD